MDEKLYEFLIKIAAQPPVGITGAGIRLALELAKDHGNLRRGLYPCCQAMLLAAQMRVAADANASEELLDGFRAPTWFVWSSHSEDSDRENGPRSHS